MQNSGKLILYVSCIKKVKLTFMSIMFLSLVSCNKDPVENLRLKISEEPLEIVIAGQDTLELRKKENNWFLNSGFQADSTAIQNFLYIFRNLEISGISRNLDVSGMVRREVSITTGKKTRNYSFYSDSTGNFLSPVDEEKVYRISITSVPDSLIANSVNSSPGFWESRLLIDIRKESFKKITIKKPGNKAISFSLEKENDGFILKDSSGNRIEQTMISKEQCDLFLSYLSGIYTEGRITETGIIEQLELSDPVFTFSVQEEEQDQRNFAVYDLYDNQGRKSLFTGAIKEQGIPAFMKINFIYLDPLLQEQAYFTVK